jgi:capsular polysaccharide biosynthesis protein
MNSLLDPADPYGKQYESTLLSQINPLQIIRRRLWVIVLTIVVCAGLAAGFSYWQTPTYEASIMVLIGQKQSSEIPTSLQGDVIGLQEVTQTVATAPSTGPIVEGIAEKLNLHPPVLPGSLSAEPIEGTTFVQIYYDDTDPNRAKVIANTAGDVLSQRIAEVSPGSGITATVWQKATTPGAPISPNPPRNIVLGLLLGVMVGVGLAFLLDYLDDDWTSPEEAAKVSGVPTFGVIPMFDTRKVVRKLRTEKRSR